MGSLEDACLLALLYLRSAVPGLLPAASESQIFVDLDWHKSKMAGCFGSSCGTGSEGTVILELNRCGFTCFALAALVLTDLFRDGMLLRNRKAKMARM